MKFNFDYYRNLEKVELSLCNPDGRELFPVVATNRQLTLRFNDLSELSFDCYSTTTTHDGEIVGLDYYDYIQTRRLIFASDIGWFVITKVKETDNGVTKTKSVSCESLQATFKDVGFVSQEKVYYFYDSNDPTGSMYDPEDDASIPSVMGELYQQLGIQQLEKEGIWTYSNQELGKRPDSPFQDWTITYISPYVRDADTETHKQRARNFKDETTYGYDWMVKDVSDAFEVMFLFDYYYKCIEVVTAADVTEQKSSVIFSFSNFMKEVDIEENADDIVTVLNCNGANCNIEQVNPTGNNYICDFSYFMDETNHRWMSSNLIAAVKGWKTAVDTEMAKDVQTEGYKYYINNLNNLYETKAQKEAELKLLSKWLDDLKVARDKKIMYPRGTMTVQQYIDLYGIVAAESVEAGKKSIVPGGSYSNTAFNPDTTLVLYTKQPEYSGGKWIPPSDGATATLSPNSAVSSADPQLRYLYFIPDEPDDDEDGKSYCKLQTASKVDKETNVATYYCSGFVRYIDYDLVEKWIAIHERLVKSKNTELELLNNQIATEETNLKKIAYTYNIFNWIFARYSVFVSLSNVAPSAPPVFLRGAYYSFANNMYTPLYSQPDDWITSWRNYYTRSDTSEAKRLIRELHSYWIEGDYDNDNISLDEEATQEESFKLSQELLESGKTELSKICQPKYTFSLTAIDFTKQYEFRNQTAQLELGKIITVEKEEGLWYYPALLEINMSLDNSDEFTLSFANAMRLDKWGFTYGDLIAGANSTSRKVSANWQGIMDFSNNREEYVSMIREPLSNALRASFANAKNQEFEINDTGILGRKLKTSELQAGESPFEGEQIKMLNNQILFTSDGWEHVRTALGKITVGNTSSYGLVAETLIGNLVLAETMKIRNDNSSVDIDSGGITIKNGSTTVFQATTGGDLTVRGYATESQLNVKAGEITAEVNKKADSTHSYDNGFGWTLNDSGFFITSKVRGTKTNVIAVDSASLTVRGNIYATGGDIGGCTITNGTLSIANALIKDLTVDRINGVTANTSSSTPLTIAYGSYGGTLNPGINLAGVGDYILTTCTDASHSGSTGIKMGKSGGGTFSVMQYPSSAQGSLDGSYYTTQIFGYSNVEIWTYNGASGMGVISISTNTGHLNGTWYHNSSPLTTSDRNTKHDIKDIDNSFEALYDSIRPRLFKYNDGTSDRYHLGFVAQEVDSAREKALINRKDLALLCISEEGSENERWALRYDEFIALNTWEIQKLKTRIKVLEDQIAALSK